eukprot:gene4891-6850_t
MNQTDDKKNFKSIKILNPTERIRKKAEHDRALKRELQLAKRRRSDLADESDKINAAVDAVDLHTAFNNFKINSLESKLDGLRSIRRILCSNEPQIQPIIDNGLIPYFTDFLTSSNSDLKVEATWCLTNIATGDHSQTKSVLEAVPNLIFILSNSFEDIILKEQVCWTIGNIAGDSDEFREILLLNGVLLPLTSFFNQCCQYQIEKSSNGSNDKMLLHISGAQTAAWALSNLVRGTIAGITFINSGIIPTLLSYFDNIPFEIQTELVWFFVYLTAKDDATVQYILENGLLQIFKSLFLSINGDSITIVPFIRCLGNLSSGPHEWIDRIIIECSQVLSKLIELSFIHTTHRTVLKESLWVISNFLGSSNVQVHNIIMSITFQDPTNGESRGLLNNLVDIFTSYEFDLQREALFAIFNLSTNHWQTISPLFHRSEIWPQIASTLFHLLKAPDSEVIFVTMKLIRLVMLIDEKYDSIMLNEELNSFMIDLGLLDLLEEMQYNASNQNVSEYASEFANKLFEMVDDQGVYVPVSERVNDSQTDNNNNNQVNMFVDNAINSTLPSPPPVASLAYNGVGRGSHLLKPSWMN